MAATVVAPAAASARAAAAALTLSPTSAVPGTQVTATGTGFSSGAVGDVRILVGRTAVAEQPYHAPSFTVTFPAPSLAPGIYTVTACIARSGVCSGAVDTSARARLRILAPPPPPTTRPPLPPPTTQPPPAGPSQLEIDIDPVCCDPPGPSVPQDLLGPSQTPGPALQNPGTVPEFPDLFILGIEVTQNIQDVFSTMPLVAGRKTLVRVHPRAHTGSWAPVDGAILVKRGDQQEILYPVNGPIATGLDVDRTDLNTSLNFVLDPKWYAEGALTIRALVWSFSPDTLDDREPNPENNLMVDTVVFQVAKKPNIHVVPLDDGDGPGPSPSLGWTVFSGLFVSNNIIRNHPIADTNLKIYPIPVGPPGGNGGLAGNTALNSWDLTTSYGRTQPLQQLFWYHQALGLPSDERLFGIFDSSIPSGGYSGWAKSIYKSAWTKPKGTTPSHEAGHLTGLNHVDCKGNEEKGGALDPTHPNARPNCSLAPIDTAGYFGTTVYDAPIVIYSNNPNHPQAAFPLMSYKTPQWNDPYHWCKMLTFYEVPCSPATIGVPGIPIPTPINVNVDCDESVAGPGGVELKVCLSDPSAPDYDNYPELPAEKISMVVPAHPQSWLLVTGVLTEDGGVINRTALVDEVAPSLAVLAAEDAAAASGPGTGGANEIVLIDSQGGTLARVKLGETSEAASLESRAAHGDGGLETSAGEFAKVIPIAGNVADIKLLAGGKVMATSHVSAAAPSIGGLTVTPGADALRIRWNVSDADGDPVTSDVLWSIDGQTWMPVALETTATEVLLGDGIGLPGGSTVRIKVVAHDGVRTSESVSAPFSVDTKAPVVAIGEIPDGSTIPLYYLGDLTALGYDAEDGHLAGDAITWQSDLDGDLGTGNRLALRGLSAGEHTITATASDSTGATGSDTLHLIVVDTGAPAPRMQGAVPDAERRLLAGKAVLTDFGWIWAVLAGAAVAMIVVAAAWLVIRRRRRVTVPSA